MEIEKIESYLNSYDSQQRLKALTELKHYDSAIAIPLLMSKLQDPEFIVRSFVAIGLGNQPSPQSFKALVDLLRFDHDHNVRAEAAYALSQFGEIALPHLIQAFQDDTSWLVRRSVLTLLMEMPYPDVLYEICIYGLADGDQTVKEAAIDGLGTLAGSPKQEEALQELLKRVGANWWRTRVRVALALHKFHQPQAKAALSFLTKDDDHRVVGAALEGCL